MPTSTRQNFLELVVDRYRFALRADCVLGVVNEAPLAGTLSFREQELPLADLRRVFAGRDATALPFAVALEAGGDRAAVGVDAVGHVRRDELDILHLPPFGIVCPALFAGALRDAGNLLLVLEPAELVRLAQASSAASRAD